LRGLLGEREDVLEVMATENTQRILVVDDEEAVRALVYDFLTMEGYSVTTAEDGIAALKKLQAGSYDLLITDLAMPNMGGVELLDRVCEKGRKITALVITGEPGKYMEEGLGDKGAFACVPKPFQLAHLSSMVRKGLSQTRPPAEI
jgi:CheY-like chemotaxis protein